MRRDHSVANFVARFGTDRSYDRALYASFIAKANNGTMREGAASVILGACSGIGEENGRLRKVAYSARKLSVEDGFGVWYTPEESQGERCQTLSEQSVSAYHAPISSMVMETIIQNIRGLGFVCMDDRQPHLSRRTYIRLTMYHLDNTRTVMTYFYTFLLGYVDGLLSTLPTAATNATPLCRQLSPS